MSDSHLVDWAIERLGEPREKPLFLAVGFRKPHLSWFVPRNTSTFIRLIKSPYPY